MCLDLNRCLYWSAAAGLHLDAPSPPRTVLTVLEGSAAGEEEGPLGPANVVLGVTLAAIEPLALDLTAVQLVGFDFERLPKLREAMRDPGVRCARAPSRRSPAPVRSCRTSAGAGTHEGDPE